LNNAAPHRRSRLKKVLLGIGALFAVLLAIAVFALETSAGVPERSRFTIDLEALRAAAGPEDALPIEAHAEQVAKFRIPRIAAMAGASFERTTFGFYVWQLVYSDGTTAVLDAVHSLATHKAKGYDLADYDGAAWSHQENAVKTANIMACTHEHHDHLGGFSESAHFASFGDRLKLTKAQREEPKMGGIGRAIGGVPNLDSGPEGSIHPIGPGLVAISAPGHTPGSQIIYVRMKGARELLLIGDIAWQNFVLDQVGNRPRAVTWLAREDGEAVGHQLRAILDVKARNPALDVVVAHDVAAMETRFRAGMVISGLR
jgi:glyoxylase-like metal-dependent hydrolase (beta-lactamase superfamily II)